MTVTLTVVSDSAIRHLDNLTPEVRKEIVARMKPVADAMAALARSNAEAHIHFLGEKPGFYLASIYGKTFDNDRAVGGFIRSGSPLAHLMEEGATRPAHDILPTAGDVLAFNGDAGTVFARSVHSPGSVMPPYPAMRPAFESMQGEIKDALNEAAGEGAHKAWR